MKRIWIFVLVLIGIILSILSVVYAENLKKIITGMDVYNPDIEIPPVLLDKAKNNPDELERVIIIFDKKPNDRKNFIENLNGRVIYDYNIIEGIAVELPAKEIEKLRNMKNIKSIEEDQIYHTSLDQSVPLINADDVWNGNTISGNSYNGSGVKVCVVDTGVDYTHPALQGKVVAQQCYCQGTAGPNGCCPNGGETDTNAMDDVGHGTHVSGIIASQNETYRGVSPGADLMAVKVCYPSGGTAACLASDIIAGVQWCSTNSADVISISIGGTQNYSSYCDNDSSQHSEIQAINTAVIDGSIVVIASGNNGYIDGISSPACASKAISVGATNMTQDIATYTNRNNILDILAPGSGIRSTQLGGGFVYMTGTSMATPHVSGVVALLLQEDNSLTAQQAENILKYSGVPIYDSATGLTFPRIDALAAINLGKLEPYLITGNSNVNQNNSFNFQTGIKCTGGDCGNVSSLLRTGFDSQSTTCSEIWGASCGNVPDADNTLDSCSTGAGGDENIREVYLNKDKVGFGEEIEVVCEVNITSLTCGSNGYIGDQLYVYYRNSSSENWRKINYVSQVSPCNKFSVTFTPDSVEGEHQIRCIVGWNIPESSCGFVSGGYYDNDDANFTVVNNIISTTEATPFYTTDTNPRLPTELACLLNMQNNNECDVSWSTNATGLGNYSLYSVFSSNLPIPVAESEKVNITITEQAPTLPGDVNGDCVVDVFDLAKVGLCFDCTSSDSCWTDSNNCQIADISPDNIIDIFDLATVGLHFDEVC